MSSNSCITLKTIKATKKLPTTEKPTIQIIRALCVFHRFATLSPTASVSKTCLVRFDNNKYSVAASAVGRPVDVHACADRIVIRQDGRIVAEHRRSFGRSETIYDPWHLALRAGARPQARGLAQRRSLQGLGVTCRDGPRAAQAYGEWRPVTAPAASLGVGTQRPDSLYVNIRVRSHWTMILELFRLVIGCAARFILYFWRRQLH
jgi:hypothetical protein